MTETCKPATRAVRAALESCPVTRAVVPPLQGMEEAGARLVLAVRWLLVAMLPYAAVCLVILRARFLEGSHDPQIAKA